ncbi:amidohydrolase family protein [Cuneatibacter caecimuris]|uniref:5-methylthioadenosine/S-adenosylhomocysteine deaminase n=1 Tax=Cuneatibacter caecimuris TaxID=1796618 RepID=A0A4Q7NZP7_9FIRM|nr:amidohydrolase [Cuneatibacter caecimuris]RZS92971.1 5-methylthioadenosine/S-adenosylhomocysteine deaminase [Cuneatibacter caecimuris]
MKTRIYGGKLLTRPGVSQAAEGEVWIEDSRILMAGPADRKAAELAGPWDVEINASRCLVLPGFKNAHTHSAMTFLRSYADDLPLQEWLTRAVFPLEAKLTPENIYDCSRLAVMEYLSSGITANFDMYYEMPAAAKASEDCGFRTVFCGGVNDPYGSAEEITALLKDWYERLNGNHPLISFRLGFHAEYTTCAENLKAIAELAQELKAPVYTHNSETRREVKECVGRYGMTPTAYLDSLGMFDFGGGGFHCNYLSEEDIEIFRERKLYIVTNPASNCKLASGIAPLVEYDRAGIGLALGTDGPASNNCLDMFREMFLATALQKLSRHDASAMDAGRVLRMATEGGAMAMGLTDCLELAPGQQADLILIDLDQPNMQPEYHLDKNLVYSGSKSNVKLTMVAGKVLYENGEYHIGADPEEIYARAGRVLS